MRRIFVVGYPRSGTTLVQSLLGAHPDVFTFPETHFFLRVVPLSGVLRTAGLVRPDALRVRSRLRAAGTTGWVPGPASMARPLVSAWTRRYVAGLDEQAADAGRTAWLDKTPGNYQFLDEIGALVPGAKVVHVLRRGVDTVASQQRAVERDRRAWTGLRTWADTSPDAVARGWLDAVDASLARLGAPGHVHVRYEDVTRAPEMTLRRMLRGSGLRSDAGAVAQAIASRRVVAESVTLQGESWKGLNVQEIRARSPRARPEVEGRISEPVLERMAAADERVAELVLPA